MRVFMAYTLCMYKQPLSMKDIKKNRVSYERIRDNYIKDYVHMLIESEVKALRDMRSDFEALSRELRSINQVKECVRCDRVKPARVRHCKTCGQCVMRMDHHCVLVNNCVGIHNHIYLI